MGCTSIELGYSASSAGPEAVPELALSGWTAATVPLCEDTCGDVAKELMAAGDYYSVVWESE